MKLSLLLVLLFAPLLSWSQPIPPIRWQKCYGGNSDDLGFSILQTADGGSIIAGYSYSPTWDSVKGYTELLILKIDSEGTVEWKKELGGPDFDFASDIIHTADDNYIVVGSTASTVGDVTGNHGREDVWVIKVTLQGEILWKKCFGGSSFDIPHGIAQDSKGTIAIIGITESEDGDVSGLHSHQHSDVWVLKIDLNGNLVSQKCYGGSEADAWSVGDLRKGPSSIAAADNDGFVFASTTASKDGDLIDRTREDWFQNDIWVVKIDSNGTIEWQQHMGDENHDDPYSIIRTSDSGYLVAGLWAHSIPHPTQYDGFLRKIRKDGSIEWQRLYGTDTTVECLTAVLETDEGYLLGGMQSHSFISRFSDESEAWLISVDRSGTPMEKELLGGSERDYLYDIIRKDDGSYEVVGASSSMDGTLQTIRTDSTQLDIWVFNLWLGTGVKSTTTTSFDLYPNPTQLRVNIDFGLDAPANIRYELRTLSGDLLEETAGHLLTSGKHSHRLNLSPYSSGSYLYTQFINGVPYTETIRLVK